jgi:hypothetical protein
LPTVGAMRQLGGSHYLDRSRRGSELARSIEPQVLARSVGDVRVISEEMGDGAKRIYAGERTAMKRLLPVPGELADQADLVAAS